MRRSASPLKIVIPLEKYFVLSPGDWLLECQVVLDDGKGGRTADVPPFRFSIP